MKIDITSLLNQSRDHISERGTWDPTEIDLDSSQFSLESPVSVEFNLTHNDGTVEADGTFRGELTSICGRCLVPFNDPISGDVEALFLPSEEALIEAKEEADDALYVGQIEDQAVDLGSIVRQDVLVQCPMRPLCRDDCEGLCPECGTNLNEDDCGHEQEMTDPRLSKLEEIAEEISDEES